ncbi:MAG: small multi-drug export protein [Chloroflexi bacterium]|nr:small multi-drug export protein [Chloroflexota bacterium]
MTDELTVILTSMTPIGELRAAIPLGLLKYDLGWPLVFVLAVIGNLIPIPFIIVGLRTVGSRLERRDDFVGSLLRWRTERIERTWGERVRRYGFWAVMFIVAIPLPLTGAWTGSLAVWALRVPLRTGFSAIAAGVLVAGVIVTAVTKAGIGIFGS